MDLNATQAAIRTGFSAKTARQAGYRLLTHAHITDAIAIRTAAQLAATDITAAEVKRLLVAQARTNPRACWTAEGKCKAPHELTDDEALGVVRVQGVDPQCDGRRRRPEHRVRLPVGR